MLVCFEIMENEEIKELQTKVLENKRQTEEEHEAWMSDTDKIDDYIFQCIADLMTRRGCRDANYLRESNVWEYQVCTDDREELYLM